MRRPVYCVVVVFLALVQPATKAAQEADAWAGTWKLYVAQSFYELSPAPKSEVVRFERSGEGWEISEDVNYVDGSWMHRHGVFKFDGIACPVAPVLFTTWAFTRIDEHSYDLVEKRGGSLISITRTAISTDGTTRTSTTVGTNEQGRTVQNIAIYERQ